MRSQTLKKSYVRVPNRMVPGRLHVPWRFLVGTFLAPVYWFLANRAGAPGMRFRTDCARLGLHLLFGRKAPFSYADIYRLLFWPMDSMRYFEFDFAWKSLSGIAEGRYLDVSSPRLFPVMLLKNTRLSADLINPDPSDLAATATLVKAAGLDGRCTLHGCPINTVPFERGAFDVITSISVLEHIPADIEAIRKMWSLLKPGGRLLLTIPCASEASEEYLDRDEYGLLERDDDGFFFFQRYYDQALLSENVLSITGQPIRSGVYGERTPGAYRRNVEAKLQDPNYPIWREPYMMAKEYRYFGNIDELPGVGVVAMEFIKA